MPSVMHAVLRSWAIPPAATFGLALAALVYLRGWLLLRRAGVPFVRPWRAAAFLLGLLSIGVALASPLDTFAPFVLTAHMLQHMLLMMVAPPLLLLGAPLLPLLRGMPVFAARELVGRLLNWKIAQSAGRSLIHPVLALLLMGTVMLGWHVPVLYELALSSSSWHEFEHVCFLVAALIFWWPVLQPWPAVAHWPRWSMVPYLLVGDLLNTILSAILVFSDRVLYPTYATGPRLFSFSALQDQAAAGAIMWIVGSIAFILPAILIAIQCLSRKGLLQPVRSISLPDLDDRRVSDQERDWAQGSQRGRIYLLEKLLPAGTPERTRQAISFVAILLLTCVGLGWALSSHSEADEELVVRSAQRSPGFDLTLLTARELTPGRNQFAILVQKEAPQNVADREVLLDADIELNASPANSVAQTISHASFEASQNKMMQVATLSLPISGLWTLKVTVRQGSQRADFFVPLPLVDGNEKESTNR